MLELLGLICFLARAAKSVALPAKVKTTVTAARTSCTITSMSQVSNCLKANDIRISNLEVPGGQTLMLHNLIRGAIITFTGTTTFGHASWSGPLISISGQYITVEGNGILDGQGALYWDGRGTSGLPKQVIPGDEYAVLMIRPKFFYAHSLDYSTIRGITLKNTPLQAFSLVSDGLVIDGVTIDNRDGDIMGGSNTDGFDISNSNQLSIKNSIVHNQDDCVAINSGTEIMISGLSCSGGHGISIGSVGGRSNNIVSNVIITESLVTTSTNGLRIKTVQGATGSVSNIAWSNIHLADIKQHAIVIQQDYRDGGPTGVPTDGVPISDVSAQGITGTTAGNQLYIL